VAGFHAGPLSSSNLNLEILVFMERGKPQNSEKNPWSKERTNNELNPYMSEGKKRIWVTLVGGAITTVPSLDTRY